MTEDLLIDRPSEIPSRFLRLSYRNLCPQTVSENYYISSELQLWSRTFDATVWVFLYFLEIKRINVAQC